MKNTLWILVANASEAKLFTTPKLFSPWELMEEFTHPASRERDLDLVSDKLGHYQKTPVTGHGGSFVEASDPKKVEAERFAMQLADILNKGRSQELYHELVLVVPAHFYGLLKEHCNEHVLNLVKKHIGKDYTKLKEHELMSQIKEQYE